MLLFKPKFWDQKINLLSILFLPFSFIVLVVINLRKLLSKNLSFRIPIICIGNIYLGGTGKTPTSIFLGQQLLKEGKNPVIIRKFYSNHKDEHDLIKSNFSNMILNKDRVKGINKAEDLNYDVAILDDGFQDYKIKKDVNIICFNQKQLTGNGFIFPSGPLRDSLNSLRQADIVLINGANNKNFEKKILAIKNDLKIFYSFYRPVNLNDFTNKKLLALAGIANPENFFHLLKENNIDVQKKLIFPDHHIFSEKTIKKIIKKARDNNLKIIMTEKDYHKVKNYNFENWQFLKVSLEIHEREKFLKTIKDLYEKKN